MNDDWIDQELRRSLRPGKRPTTPDFGDTIRAAEAKLSDTRRPLPIAGAAVAMVALTLVGVWMRGTNTPVDEFHIGDALLGSTQWTAPSDVLLPAREFDIYRDLPELPGSTESEQGTLL